MGKNCLIIRTTSKCILTIYQKLLDVLVYREEAHLFKVGRLRLVRAHYRWHCPFLATTRGGCHHPLTFRRSGGIQFATRGTECDPFSLSLSLCLLPSPGSIVVRLLLWNGARERRNGSPVRPQS